MLLWHEGPEWLCSFDVSYCTSALFQGTVRSEVTSLFCLSQHASVIYRVVFLRSVISCVKHFGSCSQLNNFPPRQLVPQPFVVFMYFSFVHNPSPVLVI